MADKKVCAKCKKLKLLSDFYACKRSNDSLQYACKACDKARNQSKDSAEYRKSYSIKNKEAIYKRARDYADKHPERVAAIVRASYLKHKDKIYARQEIYRRNNRGKILTWKAKRRAAELSASVSWADQASIESIYALSSFLTFATFGDGYHVDHIVPLQGENVCGLHVEYNLQILKAKDNQIKGNRYVC